MKTKLTFNRNIITAAVVLTSALFVCVDAVKAQDLGEPRQADRQVSRIVANLMQRDHLSARPLDDMISERAFNMFIKNLDPMKVYFLKSDVDEFRLKWASKIDDQLKEGEFDVAFELSVVLAVDTDVDERRAGLHPIAFDELGHAHRGDYNVGSLDVRA